MLCNGVTNAYTSWQQKWYWFVVGSLSQLYQTHFYGRLFCDPSSAAPGENAPSSVSHNAGYEIVCTYARILQLKFGNVQ